MLTIVALIVAVLFLPSPWNAVLVLSAAVVDVAETGVFVWWSRRRRARHPPAVGPEALIGRTGVVLRGGQVKVEGEIWARATNETLAPGDAIVVRSIDGLVLGVEPAPPD
jgi:membrane protein implicated in regulation of membrane protease activity